MGTMYLMGCKTCKVYRDFDGNPKDGWMVGSIPGENETDDYFKRKSWVEAEFTRFQQAHAGHLCKIFSEYDDLETDPYWKGENESCVFCKTDQRPWWTEAMQLLGSRAKVCRPCWQNISTKTRREAIHAITQALPDV